VVCDENAYVILLLILFNYYDAFYLRSLEGVFIVFAGPCRVDNFGTILAWASLGHESQMIYTMEGTLDDDENLWRL
jgi:hypothetical protein